MLAARWAVQKFKYYMLAGPLIVFLPEPELVKLMRASDSNPRVKLALLDLEMYRAEFRAGTGAWAYS